VTIDGQGNKRWGGNVTTRVTGNTWNAVVKRVRTTLAGKKTKPTAGLEDISVTVTNPVTSETSDAVLATSDIIL
jgi:hypothetical protein